MDALTQQRLEEIVTHGSSTYAMKAQAILAGDTAWSEEAISQLIDGFFNDPYLVRNP